MSIGINQGGRWLCSTTDCWNKVGARASGKTTTKIIQLRINKIKKGT